MFLSKAIFAWVFQYMHVSHLVGLIVPIYGAAVLGIDGLQAAPRERLAGRPRLAEALGLALWGIAILHNILQWIAWDNRHLMNYTFSF